MSKTVRKVSRCLLLVTILCCSLLSVTEAAESALRIVRRYCQLDSEGARLEEGVMDRFKNCLNGRKSRVGIQWL